MNDQQFPRFIWFGANNAEPAPAPAPVPLASVRSPADLPPRLFLGDLDRSSFHANRRRWRVRYTDGDLKVWCELRYNRARDSFELTQSYHGKRLIFAGAGHLPRALESYAVTPEAWVWAFQLRAWRIGNVSWPKLPKSVPCAAGFPDGLFTTVFAPVPVHKLVAGFDLLASIKQDPRIATQVDAAAVFVASLASYPLNSILRQHGDPQYLRLATLSGTGLPPNWITSEFHPPGYGGPALTVCRSHYLLRLRCVFRELERIMLHLTSLGLLGQQRSANVVEGYPNDAAFGAFILPTGAELLLDDVTINCERARPVIYPGQDLATPLETEATQTPAETRAAIAQAEACAAQCRRQDLADAGSTLPGG